MSEASPFVRSQIIFTTVLAYGIIEGQYVSSLFMLCHSWLLFKPWLLGCSLMPGTNTSPWRRCMESAAKFLWSGEGWSGSLSQLATVLRLRHFLSRWLRPWMQHHRPNRSSKSNHQTVHDQALSLCQPMTSDHQCSKTCVRFRNSQEVNLVNTDAASLPQNRNVRNEGFGCALVLSHVIECSKLCFA